MTKPKTSQNLQKQESGQTQESKQKLNQKSQKAAKKSKRQHKKLTKKQKIILAIVIAILLLAGIGVGIWIFLNRSEDAETLDEKEEIEYAEPIYSALTGLEIADEKLNSSPTYCVQIPNGSTDGARPQAGLGAAAVVFEAIAESGITRFAAIFQNAEVSAIGPVRSLRPYYLDWDTPFDCTVVHAGGSDEAMQALRVGGQRDLNESYTYMWRESGGGRNWNNLFTSPTLLNEYNGSKGWTSSQPKVFPRQTPSETTELLERRRKCAEQNSAEGVDDSGDNDDNGDEVTLTCEAYTPATTIKINFSANTSHNVIYNYDAASNTYLRSHQDGKPHLSYECPADLSKPNTQTACGEPKQLAPSVVIVMEVHQSTMVDNYHQSIRTVGSGKAKIFQNGELIEGTWTKDSQDARIIFKDSNGTEIKFSPGQLWISAVPGYGKSLSE